MLRLLLRLLSTAKHALKYVIPCCRKQFELFPLFTRFHTRSRIQLRFWLLRRSADLHTMYDIYLSTTVLCGFNRIYLRVYSVEKSPRMYLGFRSPEEAVGWMESLCRAFPTNPKEAEAALTELRRSEHAVEVSKTILGSHAFAESESRLPAVRVYRPYGCTGSCLLCGWWGSSSEGMIREWAKAVVAVQATRTVAVEE